MIFQKRDIDSSSGEMEGAVEKGRLCEEAKRQKASLKGKMGRKRDLKDTSVNAICLKHCLKMTCFCGIQTRNNFLRNRNLYYQNLTLLMLDACSKKKASD